MLPYDVLLCGPLLELSPCRRGIIEQRSLYTIQKCLTTPPCQKPADPFHHVCTVLSFLNLYVGEVCSRDQAAEVAPKEEAKLDQADLCLKIAVTAIGSHSGLFSGWLTINSVSLK